MLDQQITTPTGRAALITADSITELSGPSAAVPSRQLDDIAYDQALDYIGRIISRNVSCDHG